MPRCAATLLLLASLSNVLQAFGASHHAFAAQFLLRGPKSATQSSPCEVLPYRSEAYCNTTLSANARADALAALIPVEDMPWILSNDELPVQTANASVPGYQWWSEGQHGVAFSAAVNYAGAVNASTSFPQVCTTAASFDAALYHKIGAAVGREGRAMNNVGQAGLTYWAPNINIYRDPRWGRGQETPGEDPYVTSVYASNFVRGMQNNSLDTTRLQVSATCKHFAAYDLENWGGYLRGKFDAKVSPFDLQHTYLPAFQACMHAEGGAASGLMCSYNSVNGIPMCANPLINGTARATFGFEGYVTTDCGAMSNLVWENHYADTPVEAIQDALSVGVDSDCGTFLPMYASEGLLNGSISTVAARRALKHLFAVQMRLGIFDPVADQPFKSLGPHDVNTPAHQALALQAAEQGIVLLENNNQTLPFTLVPQNAASSLGTARSIAVLGPNANASTMMLGNYFGKPPFVVTLLEGLQHAAAQIGGNPPKVQYEAGLETVLSTNVSRFEEACAIANASDIVVLAVGNDQSVEAEGLDRQSIRFPGYQLLFINYILSNCVQRPAVVVTFSGGSMDYSAFNEHPMLGALLWAGYPGQAGGTALTNILTGVVSPSGRLPHTVYPASYADNVMMQDMRMRSDPTTGFPGRTYRYYTGPTVYPFGWFHSFTTFAVALLSGAPPKISAADLTARARAKSAAGIHVLPQAQSIQPLVFNVTNTGDMASGISLLLKITFLNGQAPGGNVADFERIFLRPGQWQVVTLDSHLHAFLSEARPGAPLEVPPTKVAWSVSGQIDSDVSGVFELV